MSKFTFCAKRKARRESAEIRKERVKKLEKEGMSGEIRKREREKRRKNKLLFVNLVHRPVFS